ncbi:MAG: 6-carboxytetrahydropterin synthase [Bacteroidales bacterium]|nr:6-carboxytetrahydropterin synthase [Bacteroidales bacterium]
MMKVTVCRKSHFNAAHRLCNAAWDDSRNESVFGVCNNPNYHGHNYDLVVKLTGEVDHGTGYVFDMKQLKEIIKKHVIKRYDHKNLNLDVEDFKSINPTAENIAISIWNIMRAHIDSKFSIQVILYETERNFVEYSGDDTSN